MARMRFSINIPNFGDFADAHNVARVAAEAEAAGWDGLFVWDHVVHHKASRIGQPFGDPWILLTAAALATSRLIIGPLITPLPRRRPEQLARQVATLDHLSGGRVVFGAGLGGPIDDEYGSFGEPTDPKLLAERLDEGLDLLAAYWSGEAVTHHGRHFEVDDVTLLPATVQQPRPPVWLGGFWPNRRPMRRAARWDGVVPLFEGTRHGDPPPLDQVRELMDYLDAHRPADRPSERAYDFVVGGLTPGPPSEAGAIVGPYAELGATWWDERRVLPSDELTRLEPMLERIAHGPPSL
jgi:alkanesulfonate monooxygenase SsuD/methylene tetrahydromethanopterin reductase-like flavin-dependent oxidoreductase (luciferase family)